LQQTVSTLYAQGFAYLCNLMPVVEILNGLFKPDCDQ